MFGKERKEVDKWGEKRNEKRKKREGEKEPFLFMI
jgi:hypothetical protein